MAKTKTKTTILGGGTAIWVVESALYDVVPKVTKYHAIELRETGVKVIVRSGWKFIGPAAGRKWFTDREKMVLHVKRIVEHNLHRFLSNAQECAEYLKALPTVEMFLCPPAERGETDKRPDL